MTTISARYLIMNSFTNCLCLCVCVLKMWEEAIILGKELAEQYENEMFDFEQLSASLVRCIVFSLTLLPFLTFQIDFEHTGL